MPDLIDDILVLAGDYHDSVREEACKTLLFISEHFINFQPEFDNKQSDILQMLRANLGLGWDKEMTAPVKAMAEMERDLAKYLFTDAIEFLKRCITVMMDEPSTRESLSKFVAKLNSSMPFLIMNDYRISLAS